MQIKRPLLSFMTATNVKAPEAARKPVNVAQIDGNDVYHAG